jgi:GGDEF domain-containing protein
VRWGGEEFLIVSRYTDRREAKTLSARVLAAVGDTPSCLRILMKRFVERARLGGLRSPGSPTIPNLWIMKKS